MSAAEARAVAAKRLRQMADQLHNIEYAGTILRPEITRAARDAQYALLELARTADSIEDNGEEAIESMDAALLTRIAA